MDNKPKVPCLSVVDKHIEEAIIYRVNLSGVIREQDKAFLPGLHFCDDWDGLAICDTSPEKDGCCCG
jgi:hypothetical protein